MKKMNVFLKAILAGVYITIAATVFLLVSASIGSLVGKIVAGTLFSIALLVIVVKDYYLYTGKVGYMLPYKKGTSMMVLLTILGNIVGILAMGLLINIAKIDGLHLAATNAVNYKFSHNIIQTLSLSFFCGILMYTAVDGYKTIKDDFAKVLLVFLSVIVFLTVGFEHSIANMAYLLLAKQFSWKILGLLVVMIIGNGLGGVFINILHSLIEKKTKEDKPE